MLMCQYLTNKLLTCNFILTACSGYMAPEYVIRGQYSTKSDVFSFGILVLEIVTGQRNSGPYFAEQNEDLVSLVSIPSNSYKSIH
jgi:serine/threonine protein kinase